MSEDISNTKIPVFVSSTYVDLIPYRDEISKLLNSMGFEVHGMENFGSRTESVLQTCLNEVRACKIFIGILGMKYGSIDDTSDKSFLEVEYEAARDNSLEILFYLIDEDKALIVPKFVDIDEKGTRLKNFKDALKNRHTVSFFESPTDLKIKVERDVKRLLLSRNLRTPVKRSVIKGGGVTIVAAGDGSYYLGEKIRLSGTSTTSDTIFLFLTGPHLNPFGVKLDNISINAISDNNGTFTPVEIGSDNVWSYEWDTSKITDIREMGRYTIYAVSDPKNKNDISSGKYASLSIILKNPFISGTVNNFAVARGDELFIRGTAEGNPNKIYLWVFGKNYRLLQNPINVEKDASFEFIFTREMTKKMEPGQYFAVLQHPMQNRRADIRTDVPGLNAKFIFKEPTEAGVGIKLIDISQLRPSDAAEKLIELLNLPDIDDTYTKLVFLVEEPIIKIDPILPKLIGEYFTITGSTNLSVGDELLIEFKPESPYSETVQQKNNSFGFSGICKVTKGGPDNNWSFDVDGGRLVKGKYKLSVTSLETNQNATKIVDISQG